MSQIIDQVETLRKSIKDHENEIDNPSLVLSILSELDFFIENIKEE